MITNCLKCAECAAALVVENNSQPSLPDHTYGQSCSSMPPSLISFKSYGSLNSSFLETTSNYKNIKLSVLTLKPILRSQRREVYDPKLDFTFKEYKTQFTRLDVNIAQYFWQ
jgi:hypothetical protein